MCIDPLTPILDIRIFHLFGCTIVIKRDLSAVLNLLKKIPTVRVPKIEINNMNNLWKG